MNPDASVVPGGTKSITSYKGKGRIDKNESPQMSVDRIWARFSKQEFTQVVNVSPSDANPGALNIAQSNRLLQDDYARAAAECRRKVEKIVGECKRVNMRYRDLTWDLDLSVVSPSSSEGKVRKAVKRIHEIFEQPTFMERIQGGDITQGNLSDCWLMTGLVALANIPAAVKRTCVSYNTTVGVYGFVFYRDGEWIYSIIDDKLYLKSPCWDSPSTQRDLLERVGQDGTEKLYRKTYQTGSKSLFFARCRDQNETWVPLIEKAYAKAHGDYSSLAGGWTGEGLEDLTGGVTTELATSDILDTDLFWHREMSKVNQDFLFGASTGYLENGKGERDGIAEAHAYIVLEARSLKNGQRLVKLRNPWGDARKGIWEGPWSDGSKEWTREVQDELGHKFGADSAFWISYDDLMRKFSLLEGPVYFKTLTGGAVSAGGLHGQYSFRLHFRLHSQDSPDADSFIARSHGNYLMNRSVSVDIPDISPGTYLVYLKVAGERDHSAKSIEEVIRQACLERIEKDKLIQVGHAYNLAHGKASLYLNKVAKLRQDKSSKKASENRLRERRRQWAKRRARRHATKKQKKKNLDKCRRRGLEPEPAIPDGQRSGVGEVGLEGRSHFIQTGGAIEVESNAKCPGSIVLNEGLKTSSNSDKISAEDLHTGSSQHITLQKLSLRCASEKEGKPSVVDGVAGRSPSQLRRKWAWSRRQEASSSQIRPRQSVGESHSVRSLYRTGDGVQSLHDASEGSSDSPVDD
ncbi:hypothetical protein MRS44_018249 [Fusarium solani]|uniref:uncharacterized protein n=1 Tax=Fusarium solani TaxID=169388 RepID=UPI0032C476E9|nr:hypothetical protein MRS44_018249 [Fusarium solani]